MGDRYLSASVLDPEDVRAAITAHLTPADNPTTED